MFEIGTDFDLGTGILTGLVTSNGSDTDTDTDRDVDTSKARYTYIYIYTLFNQYAHSAGPVSN